ncbi:tetratricopeptide repeat protein [Nocardia nepalensis]|uniref:tetratricopeptide repeat protein n=1 Tax=Nocardia nepalensis TaxID=3375448 RepID=UPI003B67E782
MFVLDCGGSDGRIISTLELETRHRENLELIAQGLGVTRTAIPAALDRMGQPYLWILDDVPSTASPETVTAMCAPTSAGRTLITTRNRERYASAAISLGPLGVHSSADVLTSYRPAQPGEESAVLQIVNILGQHPLGLTIAAGLTSVEDFTGYHRLLDQLSSAEPDELEAAHTALGLPAGCVRPFSRTLLRSFASLAPAGQEVLCAASVLAPAPIPRALLTAIVSAVTGMSEQQILTGAQAAATRGLICMNEHDFSMHALDARALRVLVKPQRRHHRLRDAALSELIAAVDCDGDRSRSEGIGAYLAHVRAVVDLPPAGDRWEIEGQDPLNETGRFQIETNRRALDTYARLVQVCPIEVVGALTHAVAVNGLAVAHEYSGDYSHALVLKQQLVQTLSGALGEDAAETLTATNNLAIAHAKLGHHIQAYQLQLEVYRRRREHRLLGPTHRDTLIALNNLAIARGHLGSTPAQQRYHRGVAHRLWLAAADRWPVIARPEDPDALDALHGLVRNLRALGMHEQALETLTDVYARCVVAFGPNHPDTLEVRENMLIVQAQIGSRSVNEDRPESQ